MTRDQHPDQVANGKANGRSLRAKPKAKPRKKQPSKKMKAKSESSKRPIKAADDSKPGTAGQSTPSRSPRESDIPKTEGFDPQKLAANMAEMVQASQNLVSTYLEKAQSQAGQNALLSDPLNVGGAFSEFVTKLAARPETVVGAQQALWLEHLALWQYAAKRSAGWEAEPPYPSDPNDRRFKDPEWQTNLIFDVMKQSYLIVSKWLLELVESVDDLDDATRAKLRFYTKQMTDAFAPTNFFWTNPEVLRTTYEQSGENLVRGLNNVIRDLKAGDGNLAIRQTDMEFFEVGRNLATTPGKVVFQNDIFQLIQFEPRTAKVLQTPLLIFPPWINKYYILDMRPDNSFVRWCLEQGLSVFVVSWVNPDAQLAKKTFEDYMKEGIYTALDAVEKATGEREIHTIGYCIGGTLLATALAHMAAHGDDRIKSATFFAAQADFSEAGDLKVFIDDQQLQSLEERMDQAGGVLEGANMAQTFNMLRANDLIWSFVVNNYLLGKEPFRFDLLFWNADATRMPKALHLFYLKEFYRDNKLAKGELVIDDTQLDLSGVKTPIFLQSSKEDHIAPCGSVFKMRKLFGGPVEFIVAGSGHIAGVINPPASKKYQYWTSKEKSQDLELWWKDAEEHPGSWWPYWFEWLKSRSGDMVPARFPGDRALQVIEDAPGSYVLTRS